MAALTSSRRIRWATTRRRLRSTDAFLTSFWATASFFNEILRSDLRCFLVTSIKRLIICFLALTVLAKASFGTRRSAVLIAFLMADLTSSRRIRWATTRRRFLSTTTFFIIFLTARSFFIENFRSVFGCFLVSVIKRLIIFILSPTVLTFASSGMRRPAFLRAFLIEALTSSRRIRWATTGRRFFALMAFLIVFLAIISFDKEILRSAFGCFLASQIIRLIIFILCLRVLALTSSGTRRSAFLRVFRIEALTSSRRIRCLITRRRFCSANAFLINFLIDILMLSRRIVRTMTSRRF